MAAVTTAAGTGIRRFLITLKVVMMTDILKSIVFRTVWARARFDRPEGALSYGGEITRGDPGGSIRKLTHWESLLSFARNSRRRDDVALQQRLPTPTKRVNSPPPSGSYRIGVYASGAACDPAPACSMRPRSLSVCSMANGMRRSPGCAVRSPKEISNPTVSTLSTTEPRSNRRNDEA